MVKVKETDTQRGERVQHLALASAQKSTDQGSAHSSVIISHHMPKRGGAHTELGLQYIS